MSTRYLIAKGCVYTTADMESEREELRDYDFTLENKPWWKHLWRSLFKMG